MGDLVKRLRDIARQKSSHPETAIPPRNQIEWKAADRIKELEAALLETEAKARFWASFQGQDVDEWDDAEEADKHIFRDEARKALKEEEDQSDGSQPQSS